MKPKIFSLAIILFAFYFQINANPDSSDVSQYEKKAIYLQTGFWNVKYVKGGEKKKLGIRYKNLEEEFAKNSPDAFNEFQQYRFANKKAGIYMGITTVGFMGGILLIEATPVGAVAVLAGSFFPYGLSIKNMTKSQNHFQKSIWLHNRDVLTKEK